ncbi:MAG TPA: PLD nuclease N-terminal domain-containing protein [Dermatophilaceae bacterium]|mgnify:CR=1 FL=1|nr:PLD nuclease N-terminal domain-containing protein [Dermatophilaceae bacterium]
MLQVTLALVSLGLTIYALLDCAKTDEMSVRGLPKLWWVIIIVVAAWVGPICWLLGGRPKASAAAGTRTGHRLGRRRPPTGPIGPEDDPEFLRNLSRKQR